MCCIYLGDFRSDSVATGLAGQRPCTLCPIPIIPMPPCAAPIPKLPYRCPHALSVRSTVHSHGKHCTEPILSPAVPQSPCGSSAQQAKHILSAARKHDLIEYLLHPEGSILCASGEGCRIARRYVPALQKRPPMPQFVFLARCA